MEKIIYQPIGIICTDFTEKEGVPIQSVFGANHRGRVEVFSEYAAGLKDIEGFSHIILIYHFHLSKDYCLTAKPFLDDEKRGIFSIRYPRRPNPVGLSLVRLDKVKGNILEISEIDIVDGTPLLDIKPYVPKFDNRNDVRTGWYEKAAGRSDRYRAKYGK